MPGWAPGRPWGSGGNGSVNRFVDVGQGGVGAAAVDEADHFVAAHALSEEVGGKLLNGGHFLWVVVEGLPSGELIIARSVRPATPFADQFTIRHHSPAARATDHLRPGLAQ
jgi:hypothetical protein